MRLWRISVFPGLSGTGGLHTDGRWHSKGRPVMYAAEHPALAMVEAMAHMRLSLTNIPMRLKLMAIDVDIAATLASTPVMPPGWQANEPTTQAIGNAWLASAAELLMPIPSAIVPHAKNYLINPAHPQAAEHLVEASIESFWIDKRFLR